MLLLLLVGLLHACAPADILVVLHLRELPAKASGLRTEVSLWEAPGTSTPRKDTFKRGRSDVITVRLPFLHSGVVSISVRALDKPGCSFLAGEDQSVLRGEDYLEGDLVLLNLDPVECPLHVDVQGAGSVRSTPRGIECSAQCEADFAQRERVILRAIEAPDSVFEGWTGCEGLGACVVTMGDMPRHVTARFGARTCSQGSWCLHRPSMKALHGVSGRLSDIKESQVIVVGDEGQILSWEGAAWTKENSATSANLRGVWGTQSLWAVGSGGVVTSSRDTSPWQVNPVGTLADLAAVGGTGPTNVWAVGASGVVLRWDGRQWTSADSKTQDALHAVWGSEAMDIVNIWAAGENGTIRHWRQGILLDPEKSVTTVTLNALWGSGPDNVWAAGAGGVLLHRGSTEKWSAVPSGTGATLNALWGSGPNDVWTAGAGGVLLHWDGMNWRQVDSGTTDTLNALWGSGPHDVWAVGDNGVILRYGGPVIGLLPALSVDRASSPGGTARSGS